MKKAGMLLATAGVAAKLQGNEKFEKEVQASLAKYLRGDWGSCHEEDKAMNDEALQSGEGRILAAYETSEGEIWIITEHDRSATTILFPDEY